MVKVSTINVTVDVAPLLERARAGIGRAVMLVKTRQRALEHELTFPEFALPGLAAALLDYAGRPMALRGEPSRRADWLPIQTTKEDGYLVEQVVYYDPEMIAAFCCFEVNMPPKKGVGCIQYKYGRVSNRDVVADRKSVV